MQQPRVDMQPKVRKHVQQACHALCLFGRQRLRDQRIRLRISGNVMKRDAYNNNDLGLVPVEAEFVYGRAGYTEMTSEGVFIATVSCFCEQ